MDLENTIKSIIKYEKIQDEKEKLGLPRRPPCGIYIPTIELENPPIEKEIETNIVICGVGLFVAGMLSGLVAIHLAILIGNLISF